MTSVNGHIKCWRVIPEKRFRYLLRMLDHISFGVSDLARTTVFYDAILRPLGYVRLWTTGNGVGYGVPGAPGEKLALFARGTEARAPGAGSHLAITAPTRSAVDAFHAAALALNAPDEGAAGLRPRYGEGYYAAFVRDPDGHRLEAVCHEGRSL